MPLRKDIALWKVSLVFIVALVSYGFVPSALADISFEIGLSGGYTNNLFLDSTNLLDRHVLNTATVKYYPLTWLETSLYGELANYGELPSLSSRLGRVAVTALPLGHESKTSLTISSSFDGRRYHKDFANFDNDNFSTTISLGYRFHPALSARLGALRQTSAYLGSDEGDKASIDLFAGINSTPYGRNSFDVEFGIGVADCLSIDSSKTYLGWLPDPFNPGGVLSDATLRSSYISPRFSRPLGEKTGLNITFLYRHFRNSDDISVYAPSNALLSPWTSVWQGTSITATVKTYLVKNMTITAGAGYWNKSFLATARPPLVIAKHSRDDDMRRVFLQFVRPITAWRDASLQPRIRFDYSHTNSTNKLYEYSGFTFETGISLKF